MTDRPSMHPWRSALAILVLALVTGCAAQTTASDDQPKRAEKADTREAAPQKDSERKVTRDDVKPSHPVRYTVKRGDTLWDIAARFLRDPWVWPEIWSVNPQIENPHLIYPGDVITLAFVGGEARLVVQRPGSSGGGNGYEKLEPQVRERPLSEAIPAIPADAIRQFLNRPRVVSREQLDGAPYIVGNYEGRLISAEGNAVFARGFGEGGPEARRYNVYRPGDALRDPNSDEILGYEAIYAGKATLDRAADPARLQITESNRGIVQGDRLMSSSSQLSHGEYIPRVPDEPVNAQIISLFDAISQVGSNQVVVLNHGEADGAEVADVLAVMQSGGKVDDPYGGDDVSDTVELPARRVGTAMIFRVFDRVSYALILDATRSIKVYDRVTNP